VVKGLDLDYDVTMIADRLKNQITRLGVDIRLGEAFQPSMVSEIKPDVIVLATGGVSTAPDIPGVSDHSIRLDELYLRIKDELELIAPADFRKMGYCWKSIGRNVVIIGGTIEGTGLAEFLAEKCRNVTVVDEGDIYSAGPMAPRSERKVTALSGVTFESVTETGVTLTTKDGQKKILKADTVITATTPRPDTVLLKQFEGMAPEVYLVGSEDKEPGTIMNAIGNGFRLVQGI
jgi:NADPH-dependent 2,4-dienoyl-CoA reductase/sulfur reductase-like enzyme